jgi:prephenate dehydrogenase
MAQFTSRLDEFQRMLKERDTAGVTAWLSEAKQVRDALGT